MAIILAFLALITAVLLARGFIQGKRAMPSSAVDSEDDPVEGLRESIALQVRGGFLDEADIIEIATERANEECDASVAARVPGMVREAFAAQYAEQATWPVVTDCDRLDDAFAALERQGIVARQNWTCCMPCGTAEIGGEMEDAGKSGPVCGYTFFHQQDTESAAEGYGVYLAYGAESANEEESVAVGQRVCDALRSAGLEPDWNGDLATRIRLPLKWQKRVPEPA